MYIFIIGPGGVGKSTSGKILANLLNYRLVDLDQEFNKKIGNITVHIKEIGYQNYCLQNSKLFYKLLNSASEDTIFVLSSGFLVHQDLDELTDKHKKTIQEKGLSILLLPSKSKEESVNIIVKRQLSRGFNLNEAKERTKFLQRFDIYRNFGHIQIFSIDSAENIAKKMLEEINIYKQ